MVVQMSNRLEKWIEKKKNEFDSNNDETDNDSAATDESESPDGLKGSLELLIERGNPMADAAERTLDRL